ncbi:MAG: redoxin domain-containing protein [Saprospiraceae bacterium]|nr:redoxin domain-containing protein [Saprospiraceae bacterium]
MKYINYFLVFSLLIAYSTSNFGQGYKIKVHFKNYENDTLLLGYYFGDKQYIKDTAFKSKEGLFTFEGDTLLESGMYLVVTKPNHNYIQLLIGDEKQKFSIESDAEQLNERLKFHGSKLNADFNAYIDFLSTKRMLADSISTQLKNTKDSAQQNLFRVKLDEVDKAVKAKQDEILRDQPKSLLSLVLRWSLDVQVPDFSHINPEERDLYAFQYYKSHYFDYADFLDERNVRLPLFFQKIERYLDRLTTQHPDSINVALDYILSKVRPNTDNHKFLLSHFLNTYANSKYVGMDGVYVHLVENYYAKGKAPWIDAENLAKMSKDAKALKPLLIDKIAPDILLFREDSTPFRLHDIKSPYTVLIFWAPDCGHCKKSLPHISQFYQKFKDKGVEVVAVCTQIGTEAKKACFDAVKEHHMESYINAYDPMHVSKFKLIYDLKTTPQIYILDASKKILTKKIAAEQLNEIMDKLLSFK